MRYAPQKRKNFWGAYFTKKQNKRLIMELFKKVIDILCQQHMQK